MTSGTLGNAELVAINTTRASDGLHWIPSLTSLAFIVPVLLLYWQLDGPSALLSDPNTGVHVRAGDWMLAHHAVPRQDLFSFSIAGRPWCDWEWLSDVVYALLHGWSGLAAIVAFSLALLCLTSVAVYKTACLHSGRTVAFAVTCLVMATTTIHWLARPHLFTWLLVAVFCWVIERARVTGSETSLLILPLLMLLWVNLHPGFLAGLLVLGVWCAGEGVQAQMKSHREERAEYQNWALWFALIGLACLAATFANPYRIQLHRHVISYLFSPATVTTQVEEWLSPDFHNPRLHWFELLLPLGAAAGLWHGLRGRFTWCALLLGWIHLALVSVRNVPIFAIICAAPVASLVGHGVRECELSNWFQAAEGSMALMRRRMGTFVCYGIAGVVLIVVFYSKSLQLGPQSSLPVEAATHLPAGRLFTTDRWADYLIYAEPGRGVFFDCRNDVYGPRFVRDYLAVIKAQPGWQDILTKYGLTVALVPKDSPIFAALAASTELEAIVSGRDCCSVPTVEGRRS